MRAAWRQQPGYVPPSGQRARRPWPLRQKILIAAAAVVALFVATGIVGAAAYAWN